MTSSYMRNVLLVLMTSGSMFLASTKRAWADATSTKSPTGVYDVRDFGATGDGKTLDTAAINKAIDACAGAGGGTVFLSPGRYLSGTITLKSHVNLRIDSGAMLLASQDPKDYPQVEDDWFPGQTDIAPLIWASDAEHVTVSGRGIINGQGESWWRPILEAKSRRGGAASRPATSAPAGPDLFNRPRPQLLRFVRCKDVVIEQLSFIDSPNWNIHPVMCERVRVDGVTVRAHIPSPNTDGINPESCKNVQINNCRLDVGDDCVTLKSGRDEPGRRAGKPNEDITITNCVMYHGHGGVSIGSEMSGGVRNVAISNCVFHGTDNGIRIKSQRGRGGVVEGISASNLVMQDVPHPFVITMFYQGKDKPEDQFPVDEGTPRFRDMIFSNITARGAKDAGSITGLREMFMEGITFTNVRLVAEKGFTCTSAKDIRFDNVTIDTTSGPAMTLKNCEQIDTTGLRTRTPHDDAPLVAK